MLFCCHRQFEVLKQKEMNELESNGRILANLARTHRQTQRNERRNSAMSGFDEWGMPIGGGSAASAASASGGAGHLHSAGVIRQRGGADEYASSFGGDAGSGAARSDAGVVPSNSAGTRSFVQLPDGRFEEESRGGGYGRQAEARGGARTAAAPDRKYETHEQRRAYNASTEHRAVQTLHNFTIFGGTTGVIMPGQLCNNAGCGECHGELTRCPGKPQRSTSEADRQRYVQGIKDQNFYPIRRLVTEHDYEVQSVVIDKDDDPRGPKGRVVVDRVCRTCGQSASRVFKCKGFLKALPPLAAAIPMEYLFRS